MRVEIGFWLTRRLAMAAPSVRTHLPLKYWSLHPLLWVDARLFAIHVESLGTSPLLPDSHMLGDHPLLSAEVAGTVIAARQVKSKRVLQLDDGTGRVQVSLYDAYNDRPTNHYAARLGDVVAVAGQLAITWAVGTVNERCREIRARAIRRLESPDALCAHWAETARLHAAYYSRPLAEWLQPTAGVRAFLASVAAARSLPSTLGPSATLSVAATNAAAAASAAADVQGGGGGAGTALVVAPSSDAAAERGVGTRGGSSSTAAPPPVTAATLATTSTLANEDEAGAFAGFVWECVMTHCEWYRRARAAAEPARDVQQQLEPVVGPASEDEPGAECASPNLSPSADYAVAGEGISSVPRGLDDVFTDAEVSRLLRTVTVTIRVPRLQVREALATLVGAGRLYFIGREGEGKSAATSLVSAGSGFPAKDPRSAPTLFAAASTTAPPGTTAAAAAAAAADSTAVGSGGADAVHFGLMVSSIVPVIVKLLGCDPVTILPRSRKRPAPSGGRDAPPIRPAPALAAALSTSSHMNIDLESEEASAEIDLMANDAIGCRDDDGDDGVAEEMECMTLTAQEAKAVAAAATAAPRYHWSDRQLLDALRAAPPHGSLTTGVLREAMTHLVDVVGAVMLTDAGVYTLMDDDG